MRYLEMDTETRTEISNLFQFGAKRNIRLGPHSLHLVKKGGFVDIADIEEESM